MTNMTLLQVCDWLQVKEPANDVAIKGVSIDSRTIQPGELFVALRGSSYDGHQFISEAEKKGAVAAIVCEEVKTTLPIVKVVDTRNALGQLAKAWRKLFNIPIVAVTGSSGKTTTKEMVASIFAQSGNVLATQGNLNNDIGVPLTLLRLTDQHQYAVIELGANHVNEIAYTVQITNPTVALITNVAPAHLAGFGSIEDVARAKGEIYQSLSQQGTAVVNVDDVFAGFWQYQLHSPCITFGMDKTADFHIINSEISKSGCYKIVMRTPQDHITVSLPLPGQHNVMNALAAAASAYAAGVSLHSIQVGLETVKPVKGRMVSYAMPQGGNVIDDSYNANPGSVKAALEMLSHYEGERVFILGDLGELGEQGTHYHSLIGKQAKDLGIQHFYACGVLSRYAVDAFGKGGQHFTAQEELIEALKKQLKPDMTVLVKGSRTAKMENVVAALAVDIHKN